MKGILIVNGGLLTPKFNEIHTMLQDAFKRRGVVLDKFTNDEVWSKSLSFFVKEYDFCLFYDKDILLCQALEKEGLVCYNNSKSIALCDDKAKMYLALKDFPMPEQMISPLIFNGNVSIEFIKNVSKILGFPIVIKKACGSFGKEVAIAYTLAELDKICEKAGTERIVLQKYIECEGKDIRLYIVDGKYVAGIQRQAQKDEFRANLTLGGTMQVYQPTKEEIDLAINACNRLQVQFAGVDILQSKNGPLLCEVNSNAHFKNLKDCTGIDFSDSIAESILKAEKKK